MSGRFRQVLDNITHVRGVRGALLVTDDDGLVVADSVMEGVRGNAVAALAASLVTKMGMASRAAGVGALNFLHLQADDGALLALPAEDGVLVVVIADKDINVGLARVEMLRAAEVVK
jgi:predicted regulator of Ras-like GTPase activity (Roadblock/LC7/MglB family)